MFADRDRKGSESRKYHTGDRFVGIAFDRVVEGAGRPRSGQMDAAADLRPTFVQPDTSPNSSAVHPYNQP
jgi:hypothetical protein